MWEEIEGFTFFEHEDLRGQKLLIVGMPDVGLVGEIASMYIVKSLQMKEYVGIDSYSLLPPVASIRGSGDPSPIRIYSNGDVAVLISDVALPSRSVIPLSLAIVEFARRRGIHHILGLTGVATPDRAEISEPGLYWVASDRVSEDLGKSIPGGKRMEEGFLVGPYAVILKESIRRRVSSAILLAESFLDIPDPEAAAVLVKAVGGIIGIEIPTQKLQEEGELLRIRMRDLMKETKSIMARMGKGYEQRSLVM